MIKFEEKLYVEQVPTGSYASIGADIGGTNSNFGIFNMRSAKPELLFSLHAKSQKIGNFSAVVRDVIEYAQSNYQITIEHALFAAAGVVSPHRDYAKPTNLHFAIDAHAIKQVTDLKCVYVVNDFEVIGYGIELIDPSHLVKVNNGKPRLHASKAILGAGTGLGKCIMFYSKYADRYVPVASEGGHADAALQDQLELKLAEYIQVTERFDCPISWEDLLSGNGIKRMYRFFHQHADKHEHNDENQMPHPDEIFESRKDNGHSLQTYNLYARLYARCAKNFALDALALGGIYIAGGIAANNLPMFEESFFQNEFVNCGKQAHLLKEIPIFVITDYNVSLYGAAQYLQIEEVCNV